MNIHKGLIFKIVLTAIALFFFVIILFLLSKYISNNNVTLLKDLLSIASTIFVSLIAVYIFQEWIVQKRLESLSNYSKDKIQEILEISKAHQDFVISLKLFIIFRTTYKNSSSKKEMQEDIDPVLGLLKNNIFINYIFDFEVNFNELSLSILKQDISLYNDVLENMNSYKEIINKENIFNLNNQIDINELKKNIENLSKKTDQNLYKLRKKLMNYKNYNFGK